MTIVQFLRILWARRLIVAAAAISCVLGAFVVTQIVPPRYQAQSRVMLDIVKPDPLTGQTQAGNFARAYTKTQIELIQDYRVAGQVVDELGWMNDPTLLTQYQNRPAQDDRDFRRWAAQRIIDGTSADLLEGSNILEITFTSNSPESARSIADAIRQAYIDSSLATRRESARRTADWFSEQARKAQAELIQAEAKKTAYERESGIILSDGKTDLESARLASLAGAGANAPMVAPSMSGPSAASLQLAQLDSALVQASRSLGPNHPDLIAMKQQRTLLASQVAQEQNASGSMSAAAASAARVGAGMLEAQKAKVMAQRGAIERARQLQSEVDLRRDQFLKTANRAAELMLESQVGETGLTPLGAAVTPQKAIFPNVPLIMFGALAFGTGFGLFIALLSELFGRRIRGVEDIRAAADVPLLAVIHVPRAAPKAKRFSISKFDQFRRTKAARA